MKTISIKGGLGNQMFQYAHGRSLELAGKKIIFDISFFNGNKAKIDTVRNFKLDNFNIETKTEFSDRRHLLLDIYVKIMRKIGFELENYQGEKYFKNIATKIRQEFTLKRSLSAKGQEWQEKIQTTENSVSVHVRRGDYVQNKKTNAFHGTCDIEYYQKALSEVEKRISDQNIEIFIFSDDIGWAKENLTFPYPTHFVSSPEIPDYEEMHLMSLCRHNIIANSTFSWWGAWLNQNPDKIVVGPRQWFTNKTADELDILPPEWIKI